MGSKFFLALNKNLDEVRGRILGMKPLPYIREVASEVCQEESKMKVMLGPQNNQLATIESSTLVTHGSSQNSRHKVRKGRPWCDHC